MLECTECRNEVIGLQFMYWFSETSLHWKSDHDLANGNSCKDLCSHELYSNVFFMVLPWCSSLAMFDHPEACVCWEQIQKMKFMACLVSVVAMWHIWCAFLLHLSLQKRSRLSWALFFHWSERHFSWIDRICMRTICFSDGTMD